MSTVAKGSEQSASLAPFPPGGTKCCGVIYSQTGCLIIGEMGCSRPVHSPVVSSVPGSRRLYPNLPIGCNNLGEIGIRRTQIEYRVTVHGASGLRTLSGVILRDPVLITLGLQ